MSDRRTAVITGGSSGITNCIAWAVTRPAHVNIDEMVVRPIAQATAGR